ncbi:MAG: hypothetical protein ABFS34_16955 [Gemmatimonadota bacterium]
MQISGLVLFLSEDAASATEALTTLRARVDLEFGAAAAPRRVPAVLTAPTSGASKDAIRAFEALAGVERVEVAFIAFEDEEHTEHGREDVRCS